MDPGNYVQTTAGYSFTNGGGASNSIIGIDNMTVYGGGGKRSKKPKRGKQTKAKRVKKTPLRKPLSKKVKKMSKMRMRHTQQLTKREKKLAKRLKHRKARTDVIDSLASSTPLSKQTINSLSPSMKKFVSKIPTDS